MNTKLRTEAKIDFEKDLFKLMNIAVFGKTMEDVRKHRDIKLVTTDKTGNKLTSDPNYHTTKYFSENLIAIEMKKTKVADLSWHVARFATEDFYEDIANDVEKWFDTSNYDKNDKRPHPISKNKKAIGLFKD